LMTSCRATRHTAEVVDIQQASWALCM
jgi:hypothetical protein